MIFQMVLCSECYENVYAFFYNPFIILQTTVVYSAKLCGDEIGLEEGLTVEPLRG
jgi:hypothetical protein